MTAQEIISRIKAKVERLYDEANNYDDSRHYLGEVFSFLSDLEKSEKPINPVCEDVERELERFLIEDVDVIVNEDTEKVRIFDVDTGKGDIDITYSDLKNLARHFAQWQKEQMMKEAVEARVVSDPDAHGADYGLQKLEFAYRVLETKGIPNGRKVRIVIVKE